MKHIFISPHMDDAVLSAGDSIARLKNKGEKIVVLNIFTRFGDSSISSDSKLYMHMSGFQQIRSFAKQRKKEDKHAMTSLRINAHYLKFIDGGFRKTPQGSFVYPTFENLFSGNIPPVEQKLIEKVSSQIKKLIPQGAILYCPLGIGDHADHLIVKKAVSFLPNRKIYWLDQPYIWKNLHLLISLFKTHRITQLTLPTPQKYRLVQCYSSQLSPLFPNGVRLFPEVFYEKKN